MAKVLTVYEGHTQRRLAYLQNAFDISYELNTTSLWTGEFKLPYSDPKAKYCETFNLVEIWDIDGGDKDRYIGLFRILPRTEDIFNPSGPTITFQLEHVLGTLLDDVMLGWHEVGNLGTYTNQSIAYILDKQSHKRWVLDKCEYEHQYLYGWQDENLLSALYSVVQPFTETDYYWEFDTRSYPWRLSLSKTNPEPIADIRYRKNLHGLKRVVDPMNLTTRLYCYGYGDGDNKLSIAAVNNDVPYLESTNVAKYGVITQVWTDERFTIAESLLSTGQAMLKKLEEPAVTYEIDLQTVHTAANLTIGDTVRMVSIGIDENMTVQTLSKDDVTGAPRAGVIVLGRGTYDVSSSVAELAERQRISETYSQGAESIFTDSYVDNADVQNPAEVTFTIPDNAIHVNEIRFSCKLTRFRAYSRAIYGGGAGKETTEDGGSSNTTSSGGGYIETTSLGGGAVETSSLSGGGSSSSSSSGGGGTSTTLDGGGVSETIGVANVWPTNENSNKLHNHAMLQGTKFVTGVSVQKDSSGKVTDVDYELTRYAWADSGDHSHIVDLEPHSHLVPLPDHYHWTYSPNHTHNIRIPEHTHGITIPSHTHMVNIPEHKHSISLPNHTHDIEYGIYKGPTASEMDVYLDDTLVGSYSGDISDINLIDYMSKNANGNIMRGNHTIRIEPNNLTRVECVFQIRLFTNSHGGGQH